MRLFCALRLPEDVLDRIVAWQRALELPDGVRVVPRENLHVTLAFLGWQPAGRAPQVAETLRRLAGEAARPRFVLDRYRETRSVAMLVFEREDPGADLANRLQLELLGRVEHGPWLPHVSVFRFRRKPGLEPPLPELGPVGPSDAALYNSLLRSAGAQYVVMESVALGGR